MTDPTPAAPVAPQLGEEELARLDALSYEDAREQLGQVVRELESGGAGLAESLVLWQRGEKLAQVCQARLDGARALVESARQQGTESAG
ncbi:MULTISPECIES: exodeoxyribonuclease VII small subunit [Desertihabitans]|uniref:Exodeoxyribonuclease 7 small subunit n=1 Tax=Desertihabitans brevis TaxID=2268447 RepID=A0A367YRP8_9ACTN|nr:MULTISPECIES: exodeoxyribonuclease VII small subunit [Desertihabitans]RCK68566.1 exodeoxyribonuclease VII small subunit [Desertihabitans brevis]